MKGVRRFAAFATAAIVATLIGFVLWIGLGAGPSSWTTLDLGAPPGPMTGRKLVGLAGEPGRCRTLLNRAGVRYVGVAPLVAGPSCGYRAAVRFVDGGSRGTTLGPGEPAMSCPVAAALLMWEWSVVQPEARRLLGTEVVAIEHLGTYNCRRIAGASSWSEHATANAIDVSAFRLADGRRLTILRDWRGASPEATFLRRVRSGACPLYATVLSPDYNAAHRDHLHLDQAARGELGWRMCR